MDSEKSTVVGVTPPAPSRFIRIRAISLGFIMFISFLWIIVLCIVLFAQWDVMDHVERVLILIMMFVDFLTVVMLPILLIQEFRPWLDAARFLFLFAIHTGMAIFFTSKSASFKCPSNIGDQQAVCGLITLFVLIASWFVPVLVVGYSCGLGYFAYRASKLQEAAEDDWDHQQVIIIGKQQDVEQPATSLSEELPRSTLHHKSFQSSYRSHVTSYGYAV